MIITEGTDSFALSQSRPRFLRCHERELHTSETDAKASIISEGGDITMFSMTSSDRGRLRPRRVSSTVMPTAPSHRGCW